ncbi:MAG TPA: PfkB family carbohydrate kinase [Nannocystaceae bacterium]|nr:PfkB family carbohydrate kinase [Nannocystaceae bacterium]
MPAKVIGLSAVVAEVSSRRREGQRIALVHGSFDGEASVDRHLMRSLRACADLVVVAVAERGHAGESFALTHRERAWLAAGIAEADLVAMVEGPSAAPTIADVEPDLYAFSSMAFGDGPTSDELDALAAIGAELYTLSRRGDTLVEWRQRAVPGTRERQRFAAELRTQFGMGHVNAGLAAIRKLRVACIGETIIDEYAYCDAIGKSGKEPMIVNRFLSCDAQAGGVLAVANHLADFCAGVEVVSALGAIDRREEFVKSGLRPEVVPTFTTKHGAPTIVKRRYIDAYSRAKMMGVYHMDTAPLRGTDEEEFVAALENVLSRSDVAIVADYGHGLLTPRAVEVLARWNGFLAVNTQLNAANSGYHVLSKYPRADYACLHEGELRMDARDLHSALPDLLEKTASRMGAQAMMATLGRKGTMMYADGGRIVNCPALASVVVERVGAGDAVLAISAVATAVGLPPELTSLLGNLAGAQMVAVMGNSSSIRKPRLVESVRHLLTEPVAEQRRIASEGG